MLQSIQALRGVAALLVLFFHTHLIVSKGEYLGQTPMGGVFAVGSAGVDIFFVLSGFIIMHAHSADISRPGNLKRYLYRRWSRVYPVYWIYLTGVIALLLAGFGSFPAPLDASYLASAYTLVRTSPEPPPLSVAWSLYHEVLFYGVFALLILNRRLGATAFALWGTFIAASYLFGWSAVLQQQQDLQGVVGSLFNLNFLLGMLACWLVERRLLSHGRLMAVIGVAILTLGAAIVLAGDAPAEIRLLFAVGSFLLLTGLVSREYQRPVAVGRIPRLFGDASYSIYLVHTPILSMLIKIAVATGAARILGAQALFMVLAGVTATLSVLCYLLVERPLIRVLRQGLSGLRSRKEGGGSEAASLASPQRE